MENRDIIELFEENAARCWGDRHNDHDCVIIKPKQYDSLDKIKSAAKQFFKYGKFTLPFVGPAALISEWVVSGILSIETIGYFRKQGKSGTELLEKLTRVYDTISDEKILFYRIKKDGGVLVLTDAGIHWCGNQDADIKFRRWNSLSKVEDKGLNLYFYSQSSGRDSSTKIDFSFFQSGDYYSDVLAAISGLFNQIILLSHGKAIGSKVQNELSDSANKVQITAAQSSLPVIEKLDKGIRYIGEGSLRRAQRFLKECKESGELDDAHLAWVNLLLAKTYRSDYGKIKDTRRCLLEAAKCTQPIYINEDEPWLKDEDGLPVCDVAIDELVEVDVDYITTAFHHDGVYSAIMGVRDITKLHALDQNQIMVVPMASLNSGKLHFENGRAIEGILYIVHPYRPGYLIPMEDYEFTLLEDKVREFCKVAQYLGACEINIVSLKETEDAVQRDKGDQGEVGYKYKSVVDAKVSADYTRHDEVFDKLSKRVELHQIFNGSRKLIEPGEVFVWYPHCQKWKDLYDQRLNGLVGIHREIISVCDIHKNSESVQLGIESEVKTVYGDVGLSYSHKSCSSRAGSLNQELVIEVKFS